jgi:hypothetical protein
MEVERLVKLIGDIRRAQEGTERELQRKIAACQLSARAARAAQPAEQAPARGRLAALLVALAAAAITAAAAIFFTPSYTACSG